MVDRMWMSKFAILCILSDFLPFFAENWLECKKQQHLKKIHSWCGITIWKTLELTFLTWTRNSLMVYNSLFSYRTFFVQRFLRPIGCLCKFTIMDSMGEG